MFPKLFSPVRIGGLEIKNRVAMTAMGVNLAAAGAGGDGDIIAFYEARARLNPVLKGRRHLLVVHRSEAGANHVGSV